MNLNVRPAVMTEAAYAWSMYKPYIEQNIFSRSGSNKSKDEWLGDEERNFHESWPKGEPYIIEVDGKSIGWLSIWKSNNRLTIQNIFIEDEWQNKGIANLLFREMIPQWKSEKRVVEVPILIDSRLSAQIQSDLVDLGFLPTMNDGLVRIMTANWSK
jgi:predicted GNAT family acetyltransferase